MKHFRISDLGSMDVSCIEGTETNMMVVMLNIKEDIPCKFLSLEDNCKNDNPITPK